MKINSKQVNTIQDLIKIRKWSDIWWVIVQKFYLKMGINTILMFARNVSMSKLCFHGCNYLHNQSKLVMRILMLSACILFGSFLYGNSQDLKTAFAKGDVETISLYLGSSIEICYLDEVDFYDQKKARAMLTSFFKENIPTAYKEIHSGSSKGSSYYTIGLLTTNKGQYRVYLYFKKDQQDLTIQEIRFDLEN